MKQSVTVTLLVLAVAAPAAYAKQSKCAVLSKRLSESAQTDVPCYCGKALANLEVTVPSGLRVDAVCGLRTVSGRWIDLRKEKASLDRYGKDGSRPAGRQDLPFGADRPAGYGPDGTQ
ncbi:MAG: hypothetical protein QM776_14055 [Rhodocyclaceae bacterium]